MRSGTNTVSIWTVAVCEGGRNRAFRPVPGPASKRGCARRNKPVLIVPPMFWSQYSGLFAGRTQELCSLFRQSGNPHLHSPDKGYRHDPRRPDNDGRRRYSRHAVFCQELMKRHNEQVTLNGFCQGGYLTLIALLSGNGRPGGCAHYLRHSRGRVRSKILGRVHRGPAARFRDPAYSYKKLPNGNTVVDGHLLGWVIA